MTASPAPLLDLEYAPDPAPVLTDYDWIVINSSAGKDSLAMLSHLTTQARAAGVSGRLVVVHCDLGRIEWAGTRELAERQAEHFSLPFLAVWRRQGDLLQQIESRGRFPGPETRFCTAHHKQNQVSRVFTQLTSVTQGRSGDLLEQVEERGMWPDPKRRYCTSDQKRAQVQRVFTALSETTRDRLASTGCVGSAAKVLNTAGDPAADERRAWMAADWLMREYTPDQLDFDDEAPSCSHESGMCE